MTIKVVGIIQARLASTRAFGKILAPIAGRPLLEVLFRRVQAAPVDAWWLATTAQTEDDLTALWGEQLGLKVYRGEVDDVLSRFVHILEGRPYDWVLRLTADNPFVDANLLREMIRQARTLPPHKIVLSSSVQQPSLPLGYVPQLARADRVRALPAQIGAGESYHRTHVLSWFYHKPASIAPFAPPETWPSRPRWRWTVDTAADILMAQRAFELFGERWCDLSYPEMEACLRDRSDITDMNSDVRQKQLEDG